MEQVVIEYQGVDYKIGEPTIDTFMKLSLMKDILNDDDDFRVELVVAATGISEEDVRKAPYSEISKASNFLAQFFMDFKDKFYSEFDFDGKTYKFIDLENITFGEYVDIEKFLEQPEHIRKVQLNKFMAFLYREVVDGKMKPYNYQEVETKAELFRNLPAKYLQGAMVFFFILERELQENTPYYLLKMIPNKKIRKMLRKLLRQIGGGIQLWYSWLVKTSQNYQKYLNSRYTMFSTFLHTSGNYKKKGSVK